MIKQIQILCVHEEINDRIEGRVGHGEPEEGQEHVLGVGLGGDVRIVVVDEVGVVRQPAHPEHDQNHNEHDADLGTLRLSINKLRLSMKQEQELAVSVYRDLSCYH